jgi:hypothetical protein
VAYQNRNDFRWWETARLKKTQRIILKNPTRIRDSVVCLDSRRHSRDNEWTKFERKRVVVFEVCYRHSFISIWHTSQILNKLMEFKTCRRAYVCTKGVYQSALTVYTAWFGKTSRILWGLFRIHDTKCRKYRIGLYWFCKSNTSEWLTKMTCDWVINTMFKLQKRLNSRKSRRRIGLCTPQ